MTQYITTAERRGSLTVGKQLLQLLVARVVFWKGSKRLLTYFDVPIVGIASLKERQPRSHMSLSHSEVLMTLGVIAASDSKLEYFTLFWQSRQATRYVR